MRPVGMELVALVTAVALLEYLFFAYQTLRARRRTGLPAPAVTGHPEFERYHRVQQNTLEQLVVFVPSLWLAAAYADVRAAVTLGVGFIIGRAMYYQGYVDHPERRHAGFALSLAANVLLVLSALAGAAIGLF
jgi:glutathione S-transferase